VKQECPKCFAVICWYNGAVFRRWQHILAKHYVGKILKSLLGKTLSTLYRTQLKWSGVREIKGVRKYRPEICHLYLCQVSCLKFPSQVVYFVPNSWLMNLKWFSYDLSLQFCGVLSAGPRQYWRHKRRDIYIYIYIYIYIFLHGWTALLGLGLLKLFMFRDHTQTHHNR